MFVRLVKGDEFIAKCMEDRPPDKVSWTTWRGHTGVQVVSGRQVTEEEVRRAMSQAIVRQVCQRRDYFRLT